MHKPKFAILTILAACVAVCGIFSSCNLPPEARQAVVAETVTTWASGYLSSAKTDAKREERINKLRATSAAIRAANNETVKADDVRKALESLDDSPEWAPVRSGIVVAVSLTPPGKPRTQYLTSIADALDRAAPTK